MESGAHLKRIAVLYPKAIGDFLFILPALHTLRRALPDVHFTLVVKTKQAPLAVPQQGTLVDDVIVLGGQTSWWDVRRKLAESKVDAVVDMAGNDQAGLILAWRGGRRIRPHAADCKGRCALYSPFAETMPRLPIGRHRVEELLSFARFLGAVEPVMSFRLRLPDQAVDKGLQRLELLVAKRFLQGLDVHAGPLAVGMPAQHTQRGPMPREHSG